MHMLRHATARLHGAVRMSSSSSACANRLTFEDLTAGADEEQLEFMKEMVIQVDDQDRVIGPITKKDGAF